MKYLTAPALLGVIGLSLVAVGQAAAQGAFNSSSLPNSNPFRSSYAPPSSLAPNGTTQSAAPVAPAYSGGMMPGPGFAGLMTSAGTIDPNHKLGRGDQLSYSVREDRETTPGPLLAVTPSGDVNVPLIGSVRAAGRTTQELASDIKGQLEKEYYWPGHATVMLSLEAVAPLQSKGRVYVTGAVRSETAVELPVDEPLTVSKAIVKAGGFRDFAKQDGIIVLRKGGPPKGIPINMKAIKKGQLDQDIELKPEDTIVVPEKTWGM